MISSKVRMPGTGWSNLLMMVFFLGSLITTGWGLQVTEPTEAFSQSEQESTVPTIAPVEHKLTVATYNIHIGKNSQNQLDLDKTIDTLKGIDADIIGLQEVDKSSPRSGFTDQAKLIAEKLQMYYEFAPAIGLGPWEFGNVLLSKHPILRTEKIQLTSEKENRTALFASLQVGEREVTVMVTHLGLKAEERKRHVQQLTETLHHVKGPLIVVGDFNCQSEASELKPWLTHLQSATRTPVVTFPGLLKQIDHIMLSADFQVEDTYTVDSDASDHVPLVSKLAWK